jgi:hypothetical protein
MLYELLDLNGCCDSVPLPSVVCQGSPFSSGRSSPVQTTSAAVASAKQSGYRPCLPPPLPMRENTVLAALRESFSRGTGQHSPPLSQETGGPIAIAHQHVPTRALDVSSSGAQVGLGGAPRGESPILASGVDGDSILDLLDGNMRSGARSPVAIPSSASAVVLGRHTLLPSECRLRHVAISRQHVKIECVGLPVEKPIKKGRSGGRKSNKPADENVDVAELSPYVMTPLGRNDVFVNGKALLRGVPHRLHVNDTISFLEDAFDPVAGIFQPIPSASSAPAVTQKPVTQLAALLRERRLLPTKRADLMDMDETLNGDFSPLQRSASKKHRTPLPVFMLRRRGGSPPVGTRGAPKRLQMESSTESADSLPVAKKKPARRRRGRY